MKNRLSGFFWAMGLFLLLAASVQAQTWIASPSSGDWNTDSNWTGTAPNSSSAFATFGTSTVTNVTLSAPATVDTVQFNGGASSYSIDTNGVTLNLGGVGVVNNSGGPQTLINSDNGSNGGYLVFANSASASNAIIKNNGSLGYMQLLDSSTAGNSTITNNGNIDIFSSATAGSATITNNGYLYFFNNATAGAASITNNSFVDFFGTSSLSTSTFNNASNGTLLFYGASSPGSTAGSATITTNGVVGFNENSTAGNAVITITGGLLSFVDDSLAGSAQFTLTNNAGGIDISNHNGAVTLFSLQGAGGAVHMGTNNLGVGIGNQSTTFSGVFDDAGNSSTLIKLGTGTLTLNGSSNYGGGTNILAGAIVVDTNGELGTGTVQNNAGLSFINNSNAGNLNYQNNLSGTMAFLNNANAGSGTIQNSGTLTFYNNSTANGIAVTNTGLLVFTDNSTIGPSTITNNAGGAIDLDLSSNASSTRFIVNGGGTLDISGHTGPVTLQSVEGGGAIALGSNNLASGFNNLNVGLSGVISGIGGSLTKFGSGTLTLSGNNTYTGGTTVTLGVVAISADNNLGTTPAVLALSDGTLQTLAGMTFTHSIDLIGGSGGTIDTNGFNSTISGVISGANALNKIGSGTLTLSGTNTYSAWTVISGGTLALAGTGTVGADSVSMTGGNFDISAHTGGVTLQLLTGTGNVNLGSNDLNMGINNQNMTLSGVISGSGGSLTKVGQGILTLSGNNTYSGGTTVSNGVLVVSADNNMGAGGGLLNLQGSTLLTSGTVISTRPVDLTGGTVIDTSGYNSTLGGNISGTGVLNKMGSGTLTLSGVNAYSGGTNILGGTLALGNSSALGAGPVSLLSGTIKMSGGPGVVTWGGDYAQSAGTTLSLGIGASQWDTLNLGGVAHLNGTLNLSTYSGYTTQVGSTFAVITTGTGLVGQFSQLTTPLGVRWIPVYGFYNLTLTAIQPSFAALALTPNQKSVATMLDGLYGDSKSATIMLDLGTQSAGALQTDYDLIAPEQLTAIYPVLYAASQSRAKAIEDRLSGVVGVNAPRLSAAQAARWDMDSPMYADSNHQAIQDRRVINDAYSYRDQTAGRWGSFLNTTEDLANIGDDANASGYKFTVTGITAGVDYRLSKDMAAGLLVGYDLGSTSSASGGKLDLNAGHAGLYGGWGHNGLHVEALAEAGLPTLKTTRAAYGGTATASATGLEFSGWLNGGYDFKLGTTTLGLFAGGQYTYASLNAFTEAGSSLPLAIPSQNQNDLRADVGVRASRAWHLGSMILTPNLGVSYEHQFDGYADDMTAALAAGGGSFTVQGPAIGQDAVALGAGVNLQFAQGIGAFVQYDGKFMVQNYDRQNFSGGVNVGF